MWLCGLWHAHLIIVMHCDAWEQTRVLPMQIPSNQMLRVFGSSRWLSTLIIAWGIVSGMGALITSANGYIVQVCCLSRS